MKLVLALLLALPPAAAWAQAKGTPPPSVLIRTEMPRQGSLPREVTAYGTVQAAPDGGSETLSLLRGVQVTRVMAVAGQAVYKGQQLLAVSADPAAVAAYHQAVAALTLAQGARTRMAQMLAEHFATRDQLAQADRAVSDAQATLNALDRGGGGSPEQTLTASFDGIVSSLLVAPGARLAAQAPLLTIARSSRLVAVAGLEPALLHQVAPGQPARIEQLYDGDVAGQQGSVLSVGAMLDPVTGLVPILVDPPPSGPPSRKAAGLLAGAPVRVIVQVAELHGWLVPRDAVLTDEKGPYLFQVNAGHAVRVVVRVVGTSGGNTLIAGPIDANRPLVTSGNYELQDGGAVREGKNGGSAPGGEAKP